MAIVLHRTGEIPAGSSSPAGIEWNEIATDWYGRPLARPVLYSLELRDSTSPAAAIVARFKIPIPPQSKLVTARGEFVEGLWNGDAAELFLLDPATARYLEFNLSPEEEWWCCAFSGYRKGRMPFPEAGIRTSCSVEADGWSGELIVPITALGRFSINPTKMKAHVAAVAGPGADRRYLSSNPLVRIAPDFHRLETFREVELSPNQRFD